MIYSPPKGGDRSLKADVDTNWNFNILEIISDPPIISAMCIDFTPPSGGE